MRKQFGALTVATLLALSMVGTAVADTTVTVTGNTVDTSLGENGDTGWWFNRDPNNVTDFEFSLDEASIGSGSLYVRPISDNPADKFIAEHFLLLGDASSWESISYDFLIAGNGDTTDADHFYLNVYTNLPGTPVDNFYECRFDYTPDNPTDLDGFATATFAADDTPTHVRARGTDVTCPETLAELDEGSSIRMFSINVGDTSANDAGLAGYLDNVAVTVAAETTTYDFEVPLQVKDDCKNGGYANFGFSNQGECVSSLQSNDNAGK